MNTLIISAVFPPESVVSSQTSLQIAQGLIERGHDVTVITAFPSRPSGKLHPGYSRRLFQRQDGQNGFDVIRCFTFLSPRSTMVSRFMENISFGVVAGVVSLLLEKPDVMYSNSWATFATGIFVLTARIRSVPIILSVQDMYPEQLIAQQRIKSDGLAARVMYWIEERITRHADGIILISEAMVDAFRLPRKVSASRLHVIPNWGDGASISVNDPDAAAFRARHAIPLDEFTIVYGGNIAYAAGIETVIESLRYLRDMSDVHLVIAGEGTNLDRCRQIARETDVPRIYFHTPWPRSENSMALSAADVLILPTRGAVSLAAMPSKLITYMLSARPVIALASPESDLSRVISKAGCGWVIEPDAPELLAATIREVRALPAAERVRRGQAGRDFALKHLTREACLPKVIDLVEQAARKRMTD